ncbi:hypothetical protein R3P38DRAFT_502037 [Favolaschia claudopus]|uniref:Uncharacterized protein n=1 Tax=Favolaschia claudopus TaxID=2862362 RepID=A0AAV9ZDJ4_9AGAR
MSLWGPISGNHSALEYQSSDVIRPGISLLVMLLIRNVPKPFEIRVPTRRCHDARPGDQEEVAEEDASSPASSQFKGRSAAAAQFRNSLVQPWTCARSSKRRTQSARNESSYAATTSGAVSSKIPCSYPRHAFSIQRDTTQTTSRTHECTFKATSGLWAREAAPTGPDSSRMVLELPNEVLGCSSATPFQCTSDARYGMRRTPLSPPRRTTVCTASFCIVGSHVYGVCPCSGSLAIGYGAGMTRVPVVEALVLIDVAPCI